MVTYVQIGKGERMAINDTVKNIRSDFIKQLPSFKRLRPVYFYSGKNTKEPIGILTPYRTEFLGKYYFHCVWETPEKYWDIDTYYGSLSTLSYGTVGYNNFMEARNHYKKIGYTFW